MKKKIVTGFTSIAVLGATVGIYVAIHSALFLVQVVEVADQPDNSPMDAQMITQLAAIPNGIVNLFDLDLKAVEKRILTQPWIREVRLQKRFPQTLSVGVVFREPSALFQGENGTISYVDFEGKPFGVLNLKLRSDYPLLSGFTGEAKKPERIKNALALLEEWERSPLRATAKISTLSWHAQHGYRALVSYSLNSAKSVESPASHENRGVGRALVTLGQDFDAGNPLFSSQLSRLNEVFRYLGGHSIQASQIFADVGKKIVVKTSRGS